jgi:hypothetical protein
LNGSDKAIPPARNRFDIQGLTGVVTESFAEFLHGRIQAVVYFLDGVARPEFLRQLLAGDQLSWPLNQKPENTDGLALDVEANSMLVDFAGLEIDPKWAKGADRMGIRLEGHRRPELRPKESLVAPMLARQRVPNNGHLAG